MVGPEEEIFVVHQGVLCQSPALAAMCLSDFRERHDQIIRLPEDRPYYIQLLLEYLYSGQYLTAKEAEFQSGTCELGDDPGYENSDESYSGDFCPFGEEPSTTFEASSSAVDAASIEERSDIQTAAFRDANDADLYSPTSLLQDHDSETAENAPLSAIDKQDALELEIAIEHIQMYVLGDRFLLEGLMRLAMMNMLQHIYIKPNPTDLLNLAAALYPYLPEGDDVFRPFFQDELLAILAKNLQQDSLDVYDLFAKHSEEGGLLANDISKAVDSFGEGSRSWKTNVFVDRREETIW